MTALSDRVPGPDVTRALALIGVVVMNYHGYLNGIDAAAGPGSSFAARLFDPWTGVLSTRFAATFVMMAGVGVTLLTNRSRTSGDRAAISVDRWRLVRRGTLLYAFGFVLDWIWPGTILVYYGAMFVVAALLFTLRTRWIVAVGAMAAVAAAAIEWWATARALDGVSTAWLLHPGTLVTESPRGLLFDTFVNGTHPLLPWLAFLCAGIVVGRALPQLSYLRLALDGALLVAVTYLVNHLGSANQPAGSIRLTVLSTHPFDRGLLYTAGALGSALCAFALVSLATERWPRSAPVRVLQAAGQTTLTLYVLHVLVFNVVVHRQEWVTATGLDTALVLAAAFWLFAVAAAATWQRRFGRGPLEVVYRRFGG